MCSKANENAVSHEAAFFISEGTRKNKIKNLKIFLKKVQ